MLNAVQELEPPPSYNQATAAAHHDMLLQQQQQQDQQDQQLASGNNNNNVEVESGQRKRSKRRRCVRLKLFLQCIGFLLLFVLLGHFYCDYRSSKLIIQDLASTTAHMERTITAMQSHQDNLSDYLDSIAKDVQHNKEVLRSQASQPGWEMDTKDYNYTQASNTSSKQVYSSLFMMILSLSMLLI